MCELFAMSARHPTTVRLSLEEFSRHGGLSGPHKDGWGIGWYEETDFQLFRERNPASSSACVRFIQANPPLSSLVISHIRKATQGLIASRNCQPFVRELGGQWHSFAHNGNLKGISDDIRFGSSTFLPVGETDSERAFCALMDRFRPLWSVGHFPPLEERTQIVTQFAAALRELGPANFLYSDGDALFVHADRRTQNDGTIRAPGMWRLARRCPAGGEFSAEGLQIIPEEPGEQEVCLFASVPLTSENWVPLAEGEILVAQQGWAGVSDVRQHVL